MKQKIIPIVSIIIGILAGVLTYQYIQAERRKLQSLEEKLFARARKIPVVVAARDIPAQTEIGQIDLALKEEYQQVVGDRAVTQEDAATILKRKTMFSISRGDPILWAYIEGGRSGRGLASVVQPGMRALSLPLGGPQAVSSMIEPNDRVDVLGTFSFPSKTVPGEMETVTLTVLQDVTVLATGQQMAKQMAMLSSQRPNTYNTVTLEVTPREAELLVFAQQLKGSLSLTLRNSADVSFEKDLPSVDFSKLETSLPALNEYRQKTIRHKSTPR